MKNPVPWHSQIDPDFQAQQLCHLILGFNLTKKKSGVQELREYFPCLPQTNLFSVRMAWVQLCLVFSDSEV